MDDRCHPSDSPSSIFLLLTSLFILCLNVVIYLHANKKMKPNKGLYLDHPVIIETTNDASIKLFISFNF